MVKKITPLDLDEDTCEAMISEPLLLKIKSHARQWADEGKDLGDPYELPQVTHLLTGGTTYFDDAQRCMQKLTWLRAYKKRLDRIERIKTKGLGE
jgi:hypothetical protein